MVRTCNVTRVALLIPLAFFLLMPSISYSGWFGPPDYEECILEHMKGTTSGTAINIIRGACRRASQSKGWFGVSDFDECILENMQGVENDSAANSVIGAWRRKSQ